jgi:hypothetical protein
MNIKTKRLDSVADSAEYTRIHRWVYKSLGKADHCSFDSSHIATRYHWSNISQQYLQDPSDWQQLCPSCHAKFDTSEIRIEASRQRAYGNKWHVTPVAQIDNKNKVSYYHESIRSAARKVGTVNTAICNALAGKTRTSAGFEWKYIERRIAS